MKRLFALPLLCATIAMAQEYTKDGELLVPKDYRSWIFLTSGIGMSYPEEGAPMGNPNFGNVFVNPAAYAAFLKTGLWPDKTILLIEGREAGNSSAVGKDSRFQTGLLAIEAHVKDSSRGGWSFYGIPKGALSGKPFAKTAKCYSCHEKNAAVDTTFVQYYPTLIDTSRQHGTYKKTAE
jgi:hypothetical protein